jgi:hypothetical protein
MPSVSLSVGRITACWFTLRSLERLGGHATREELVAHASRSSLRSGGLPIRDGLRLAIEGGLVETTQDRLNITEIGTSALAITSEDEPSPRARRFLITRLLLADPPPWVAYWQGDPNALQYILPANEQKTLTIAGLFPQAELSDDLDSWAFWRALNRVPLMSETAGHRKRIGDAGEHLSMEFERHRLIEDGRPDLAAQVQWLARESDAYGFDILSFAGGPGADADTRIAIEVKATSLPRAAELHFFLSVHEWDTAQLLGDRYRVHAWLNVDPGPPPTTREPEPIIVESSSIMAHLPAHPDCPERCRWQTAEIYLPLH